MSRLKSFHSANVAVIGASGGIGAAFCRALSADDSVATVHALSRRPTADLPGAYVPIDITDEESIESAASRCVQHAPLDLVIVASGILHRGDLQPEKSMREFDPADMLDVLRINTVGPALVAKHFLPRLSNGRKSLFAALSARVGSIADNRLGGWTSYRASKAALNMILKTLSIDHARRWPESVVVALHPGTVDTALSRPFSKRVPADKLFTPELSAERLLGVIDGLGQQDSGGFFAWDGQRIDY
jgi:NAD(P)-dependent dehydrogenase (short-subunit alcohol dehydrogenase family)